MRNIDIRDMQARNLAKEVANIRELVSYEWQTVSSLVLPFLRELNNRLVAVEEHLGIETEDNKVPPKELILPAGVERYEAEGGQGDG